MAAADFYSSNSRPGPPSQSSFLSPPQPQRASSHPNLRYTPYSQQSQDSTQPQPPQPGPPQGSPYIPPQHNPHQPSPQQGSPYIPPRRPSYQPSPQPGSPYIPPQEMPGHPPAGHLSPGHPSPQHGSPYLHPQQGPPPPYPNEHRPSVTFAPPPNQQRNSFSSQKQQYNPQYLAPVPYNPRDYQNVPHGRPYMHGNHSDYSIESGYVSDPEHHRRKHKHEKERKRRISESSRSSNTDAFIGAAGGGLIGDLIMPGLGTVGGAVVGWLGGKGYGQERKLREVKRDRAQEDWEGKFGGRSRERSHSDSGRRRSHSRKRESY